MMSDLDRIPPGPRFRRQVKIPGKNSGTPAAERGDGDGGAESAKADAYPSNVRPMPQVASVAAIQPISGVSFVATPSRSMQDAKDATTDGETQSAFGLDSGEDDIANPRQTVANS